MYNQIDANKSNTRILIYLFVFFITMMGYALGWSVTMNPDEGLGVMGVFGIIAIIYAIVGYYAGGGITLLISRAKEIKRSDNPMLYSLVDNLAITAGLPTPKICTIEDTALNAFATGRKPEKAVIVVTTGLINTLEKVELEGVIAHELSHIKNYDIRLQSVIVALVGMVILISDLVFHLAFRSGRSSRKGGASPLFMLIGGILALLSPIIAKMIQFAISREREYLADASAALLTRYPEGLARALEKIDADHEPLEAANKATAHLYIENPLRNEKKGIKWLRNMYRTHPPTTDRIQRLRDMIR